MKELTQKEAIQNQKPATLERKPYLKPTLERQGQWSFVTGSGVGICFQGCERPQLFNEWFDYERNKR